MQKILVIITVLSVMLSGCNSINSLKDRIGTSHPYEKYVQSLKKAELDQTIMARNWITAGERALRDSIVVSLPFSESGYFEASEPAARSYRFNAREGQVLTAQGVVMARGNTRCFLDLFVKKESQWEMIAHGDSTFQLTYEFTGDEAQYLVRIQPELLANVYYTFNLSLTPVLINPVMGASNRSIGSFYGDPRDGGKRNHEGVDIFATKGTPVIAPTDGYVSRIGESGLGGKFIWLNDRKRGYSYYFAHLDEQSVKAGVNVKQGDVLGKVGNTGNARHTPAHLHFGIYKSGSKDPIHYVRTLEKLTEALPWDTTLSNPHFRIKTKNASLRVGAGEKFANVSHLGPGTYVKVIAYSGRFYRVVLPDQQQGFISKPQLAALGKGKCERIKKPVSLLSETDPNAAPLAFLTPKTVVQILAHFEQFLYVRTEDGLLGWVLF